MAMTLGQNYSVEVKSRFELFMLDDQEVEAHNAQDSHPHAKHTDDDSKSKLDAQKRGGVQPKSNAAAPARGGRPSPRAPTTGKPQSFGTGGEIEMEHQKAEHKGVRHGRGHNPPVHGREFDRKSGSDRTGVKPVMKKDGHGVGNWGTIKDELEATMTDHPTETPLDTSTDQHVEGEEEHAPEPEAPPTYTLEEWKAMQKEKKHGDNVVNARPANDGQDVFKNMKLLKPTKNQEQLNEPKYASVYQKQNETDIVFFHGSNRGNANRERTGSRGGRGGRGGPRSAAPGEERTERPPRFEGGAPRGGGGGERRGGPGGARGSRGGPRGGRGAPGGGHPAGPRSGNAPQILNDKDFPSLGLC